MRKIPRAVTAPAVAVLLTACAVPPTSAAPGVSDPGSERCFAYSRDNFDQVIPAIEKSCEQGDAVFTNALLADEVCDFSKSVLFLPMQQGARDDRISCIYRGAPRKLRKVE